MSAIALPARVTDIVSEYQSKAENINAAIAAFKQAETTLEMASAVQGTYAERVLNSNYLDAKHIAKNLRISGWKTIFNKLYIDQIATPNDKRKFELALTDPPELTIETVAATFGDYLINPRFHILKGLAETFTNLDPAYKSHSNVKIGVERLPKRIIVRSFDSRFSSQPFNKTKAIISALSAYRGVATLQWDDWNPIGKELELKGTVELSKWGITIKRFMNGNGHFHFSPDTCLDINRALAEFYGDVLPDTPDERGKKQESTNVSKDLQFYPTPRAIAKELIDFAGLYKKDSLVLEPSCGDGVIMDEIKESVGCRTFGIEVNHARAMQAKAKGHSVSCANFLEQPAEPKFDFVIMNPPFYGRHYVKHINHALGFLKSGGNLTSILPATARYDHKELSGHWRDLPVASFAESGTNIPTTMLQIIK